MTSVETRDHQLDRWLLMKIEHAIENLEEHKLNNTELKKWNIRFSSMTLDQNSDLKPRFFAPKPNLPLPNDEILDEAAEPCSGDDDYYSAAYGMNIFLDSYAFSQVGLWNDGPWRSMDPGRYSTYKSLWFYGTPSLGPSPAFGALTMIDSPGKEYPHFKAVIYTDMEADDKTCFRSEVLISLRLMLAQLRKVRLMHHKIAPVLLISLTGKNASGKPKASKARSCEACRRLKTRCETGNSDRCHRCDVLRVRCSFQAISRSHPELMLEAEVDSATSGDDYHSRLCAVENTLSQLQASLSVHSDADCRNRPGAPSTIERTARDAPMNLIQEIRQNITLHEQPSTSDDSTEDIIINGIVSEELAIVLLKGFSKLSNRWLFMSTDPVQLRTKSPLLFGTCILAGLHITPSLYGSSTHQALYRHIHGLLGQAHLSSTASLDTIQSMLIFSMWDLRPTLGPDHGTSWLLSGTAAMRVIMTTSFGQLPKTSDADRSERARAQEIMRTWNLICLCQLQFSVGSGRPPIISSQYFDECTNVLDFPSYNARDELVLAGVRLYRLLWEILSSNVIQRGSAVWPEIDNLRKTQENIYKLDSSQPLRFAYACTYLILARRTLQHTSETQPEVMTNSRITQEGPTLPLIRFAISQSLQLLNLFVSMSDLTTYIHPAYENVLCSFAMVTLAEFVVHLEDVGSIIFLMEQAVSHIQCGGKAEPVSRWSLNIMKQHVADRIEQQDCVTSTGENGTGIYMPQSVQNATEPWVCNEWGIEQEFPSLEDMFFSNVI
ncbi:hypothetical protein CBS147332_2597 [Penicillium roqueforti]|nr:hypothetical protein CBS147332_2597 [Penicillium roqueforti]KAI3110114.1 hypothetical protein CBS147331_5543 [Penicillium roqueforti]